MKVLGTRMNDKLPNMQTDHNNPTGQKLNAIL